MPSERPTREPFDVCLVSDRLLVVRIRALRSHAAWLAYSTCFREAAARAQPSFVVCADYRAMMTMKPEIAASWRNAVQELNPRVARSAVLVPTAAPTLRLQMERLLREARNPNRSICTDVAEAKAWLASHLGPSDLETLSDLLETASWPSMRPRPRSSKMPRADRPQPNRSRG